MRLLQIVLVTGLLGGLLIGCSDPSLKIAIASQRRADEVDDFLFQQQHDGLVLYLYRDLAHQLATDQTPLSQTQLDTLSAGWNERDLIEHWALQHERAKALREVGVNTRLYSQQSMVDLIGKSFGQRLSTAKAAIAGDVAQKATEKAVAQVTTENTENAVADTPKEAPHGE